VSAVVAHGECSLIQASDTTYLDHAGTTLYSRSLVEQFSKDLCSNLFGNPHSASPSSALSTERTERVRARVLEFFRADPEHFDVVFVANATAAIKMVMHAFQDSGSKLKSQERPGFWYGYHSDAHTSVVGVRQVAFAGSRCFRSDDEVEGWLQGMPDPVNDYGRPKDSQLGLFAYPAQSNMNGHRLPLNWAGRVRSSSHACHKNIYTLLDAAAYVSTAQLDLSNADTAPDFTALSFYKIFGFPDLGALIVRKAAGHILRQRHYFGGGTVEMVIAVDSAWHAMKENELHEGLEDGTLAFHNIIALDSALDSHERLFGSMTRISGHTCYLAKVLYEGLSRLRHSNGLPVCEIYKHARSSYGDNATQAPTIAFNVRNSKGGWVGKSDFEQLANVCGIQLRTGGVCNPGGFATCLSLKPWELRRIYAEGMRCGNDFDMLGGKPTGIVRVSLGAMSNMKDVENFLCFMREVFVEKTPAPVLASETTPTTRENRIQSITIYPVRGAKGWQVPSQTPWEIKKSGLLWDREWCLVNKDNGETLTVDDHPNLRLLEPSLHMEEGLLKISLPATSTGTSQNRQEISVSLWESPPARLDRLQTATAAQMTDPYASASSADPNTVSLADPYTSASLADFFTSFIGFPCTLARYPENRPVGSGHKDQRAPDSHSMATRPHQSSIRTDEQLRRVPSLEKSFTISASADERSNVTTISPLFPSTLNKSSSWQYIHIGPHYFRSLGNAAQQSIRHLRHLPNLFDLSPTSQNPTIRVGDIIQTFSIDDTTEDVGLRACIVSSSTAGFICPVPTCRKECSTEEEKSEHLLVHRTRKVGVDGATANATGVDRLLMGKTEARKLTAVNESEVRRNWNNGKQEQQVKKKGLSRMLRQNEGVDGNDNKAVKSRMSALQSIFNRHASDRHCLKPVASSVSLTHSGLSPVMSS
jgi:molybdenum cofactor sulfurtransferase